MTDLQLKMLDMISYFHSFCRENNIRYFVVGGTALGVARHQGFIPWDDDIDVGLPRPDYERLKELTQGKVLGQYTFEYPSDDKTFVYPYGKMYDTTTTLIENTRYKTKRGIFIDIFPLDGSGDTREQSIENFKEIKKQLNLLTALICTWRRGRKIYKNLSTVAARLIPSFFVNQNKLKADLNRLARKLNYDDCKYVANYFGNWGVKEIAERSWFGTPVIYDFNGVKVYGPENIDAYLTALYGDWRTPPPPEKQISHHDFLLLDLSAPYTEK